MKKKENLPFNHCKMFRLNCLDPRHPASLVDCSLPNAQVFSKSNEYSAAQGDPYPIHRQTKEVVY